MAYHSHFRIFTSGKKKKKDNEDKVPFKSTTVPVYDTFCQKTNKPFLSPSLAVTQNLGLAFSNLFNIQRNLPRQSHPPESGHQS